MENVQRSEFSPQRPRLFERFEKARLPSQDPARVIATIARPSVWQRVRIKLGRIKRLFVR
jgi:hypothetical protein